MSDEPNAPRTPNPYRQPELNGLTRMQVDVTFCTPNPARLEAMGLDEMVDEDISNMTIDAIHAGQGRFVVPSVEGVCASCASGDHPRCESGQCACRQDVIAKAKAATEDIHVTELRTAVQTEEHPVKIAVIAPDVHVARSWVDKNHLALSGCDIHTMGVRMAPLSLRGQNFDRVYVVRSGPHSTIDLPDQLVENIHITLVASGGESIVVSHNDRLEPVITATCGRDGCGAVPRVVVVNRAGETRSRTAACPTHAPTFVGYSTERIDPLVVGKGTVQ